MTKILLILGISFILYGLFKMSNALVYDPLISAGCTPGNESGTEPWATFTEATEQIVLEDEHGWAKYKVDGVNVRKDSYNGEIAKTINTGDIVEYTQKCTTSEHRYISYTLEGQRYYVACSPTAERSTEWADFYSYDPDETEQETNGFRCTTR